VQCLTLEVLTEGTVTSLIVLKCMVSIGTESTRKDSNVTKDRLERLVQDVGHFVLKVLRCDERVEQVDTHLTLHSLDLSTSASNVGVSIKSLPKMVERGSARTSTDIEQDADVGIESLAKCVEEPSMRVELTLVLLLETEDHLARNNTLLSALELKIGIEGDLSCVFVNVGLNSAVVDIVLCDTVLVNTHGSKGIQGARVNLLAAI
jgi:hypothetical protein